MHMPTIGAELMSAARRCAACCRIRHWQRHLGDIRSDPGDVRDRRLGWSTTPRTPAWSASPCWSPASFFGRRTSTPACWRGSLTTHRTPNLSEVREALRHDWPLVEVTVPLVLILALGALDVVADKTAILATTLAVLVELVAAVYTRRACQEPACSGRSRQPSLPEPSAARSSCSKPSCTDRDGPHTYEASSRRHQPDAESSGSS